MAERTKRILVAVLDWGLGHAARCMPVINELLRKNCEVFIASNGSALIFLKNEFPHLSFFELPAYNPQYPSASNSMVWKMAAQLPKFIQTINTEQTETVRIVRDVKIDAVISDNRYGCYSRKVKSILIYHQLHLMMPREWKWMEGIVNNYNRARIKKFNECWIPADDDSLFPKFFSQSENLNTKFIGYLSRFKKMNLAKEYDVIGIASGPSPQKEVFAEMLYGEFSKNKNGKFLLVKGDVESGKKIMQHENFTEVNFLNSGEMNDVIEKSELLIARSGYSTVMDLMQLNKKAIVIPTPNQTEQEYLADELMKRGIAFSVKQNEFDLTTALIESEKFSGFKNSGTKSVLLSKAIDSLLQ